MICEQQQQQPATETHAATTQRLQEPLSVIHSTNGFRQAAIPRNPDSMPYVRVGPTGRYFMTEDGRPFLVIGHNEGLPWPNMRCMHYERDISAVESYIKMLVAHGVTVLRIMLEYCQDDYWYFEQPVGRPVPGTVLYWDDLIGLCERHGLRLLVVFWDTFFLSRRWHRHAYSRSGTGFESPASMCLSPQAMQAQKERIRFFVERWGNSPAIFAYDLFNEIDPFWGGSVEDQHRWVTEMAQYVKELELARWGKRHLLTVSVFGAQAEPNYAALIYQHPELDFATTHVYANNVVDNPENTISGAVTMRDAVFTAYASMHPRRVRPYLDSESGPIHAYMDLKRQLPRHFDVEYYHNMSWAHLASGGAGSGMRWPFRRPHRLTAGMHDVQHGMARFTAAIDWTHFAPQPIGEAMQVVGASTGISDERLPILTFGCSDGQQAVIWLLRDQSIDTSREPLRAARTAATLRLSCLTPGDYVAEFWATRKGARRSETRLCAAASDVCLALPAFQRDLAIAIRPCAV